MQKEERTNLYHWILLFLKAQKHARACPYITLDSLKIISRFIIFKDELLKTQETIQEKTSSH